MPAGTRNYLHFLSEINSGMSYKLSRCRRSDLWQAKRVKKRNDAGRRRTDDKPSAIEFTRPEQRNSAEVASCFCRVSARKAKPMAEARRRNRVTEENGRLFARQLAQNEAGAEVARGLCPGTRKAEGQHKQAQFSQKCENHKFQTTSY